MTTQTLLGGRASLNWAVRRGPEPLVLRRHLPAGGQTPSELAAAIAWRSGVRARVRELGWPAARPVDDPFWWDGGWWTLEEHLAGMARALAPAEHAGLLTRFHAIGVEPEPVGAQPGRLDHRAVLHDEATEATLRRCTDRDDRDWLLRGLGEARDLAGRIDWSASRTVLVHGDFAPHNLLFEGEDLTGLLDFELATIDRRVVDLILVWRCRHDDVLLAYDAISPLEPDEWRMLLVDWWATLVALAVVQLRQGREPDRWELDGLRRTSPVSVRLARGLRGPSH